VCKRTVYTFTRSEFRLCPPDATASPPQSVCFSVRCVQLGAQRNQSPRDSLRFNRLMRNFKRNTTCYDALLRKSVVLLQSIMRKRRFSRRRKIGLSSSEIKRTEGLSLMIKWSDKVGETRLRLRVGRSWRGVSGTARRFLTRRRDHPDT